MMDFSGSAGQASDFDLLPKGLIVWAILSVRGLKTSATPSRYLDIELTVDQGQPFSGRKLWDKIGDPFFEGNSENYRKMGMVAVTRILETGRGAGPNNPAGYQLDDFSKLDGLRVAVKVGIEEGTDGHDDKNRVAEWLTPNPASQSGHKGFQKLAAGDHNLPKPAGGQPASGFGGAPATGTSGGQQQTGGFGGFGAGQPANQQTLAGTNGTGFSAPPASSSGQPGANAATAEGQSQTTGAGAAPSNTGQQTTGTWLEQAQGGAQT